MKHALEKNNFKKFLQKLLIGLECYPNLLHAHKATLTEFEFGHVWPCLAKLPCRTKIQIGRKLFPATFSTIFLYISTVSVSAGDAVLDLATGKWSKRFQTVFL